jgi:23S rRNA (uracil1939-C5)-methyltransferase
VKQKKQQSKNLEITSLAFEGYGIAKAEGMVYFVKNAIPGDVVNALIKKKRKSYVEAVVQEIIEPSEFRREAICEYFLDCGGCSLQNMPYNQQIFWKKQFVYDSLTRIAKIDQPNVQNTLEAPSEFYYRNKMEFSFSANRWLTKSEIENGGDIENKNFALGLHTPKNYLKVIDIEKCHIQNNEANIILNLFRQFAVDKKVEAFNSITNQGFLKNLVIRYSNLEDKFMVILITNKPKDENENEFFEYCANSFDLQKLKISSLIWGVNSSLLPVANGEIISQKGSKYLTEDILGIKFRISPFSFFQTNSLQLNTFVGKIIAIADLKSTDIVVDLYCGAGTITLPAAKKVKKITGFEIVVSAVEDANENAKLNNINNAEFIALDLHSKEMPQTLRNYSEMDVLFIDPPRAGMHQNLLNHILEIKPPKIIYVSCNPTTQARDLEKLKEFYELKECIPVDMFPQTYHIESIIKLIRK